MILAVLSLFIQIYLIIYFDPILNKRLFLMNILFIQILCFPLSGLVVFIHIGLAYLFDDWYSINFLEDYSIFIDILWHLFFIFLTYYQWFVLFPKLALRIRNYFTV